MGLLSSLVLGLFISAPLLQDGIEVRVGSRIITMSEIDELAEKILLQNPTESKSEIRNAARNQLIERATMEEYLARFEMEATDRDITQRINLMMSSNGMKSQEEFRQAIEQQFGNFERFREDLRWQMNRARFYDLASRNVSKSPTDQELKEHFKKHEKRLAQSYFELTLAECLVPVENDPVGAKKKVDAYMAKIKKAAGESTKKSAAPDAFADCVKNDSISPSKERDGELGRFAPGTLDPQLEAKVFALAAGSATVIPGPNGFQILKVTAKKSLGNISFEAAKDRVRELYLEEVAQIEVAKLLATLKSDFTISIQNKGS